MFGKIQLTNFRCFESEVIDLKNKRGSYKPQTFIFGENVSGKTSFLLSIAFLKTITEGLTTNNILYERQAKGNQDEHYFFELTQFLKTNRRKHAEGPMRLSYEIMIDRNQYIYSLEFDATSLVHESLLKKTNGEWNVVFEANKTLLVFGRSMVLNRDIKKIGTFHKHYFGRYSLLSILYYLEFYQLSIECKPTLSDFIWYIVNIYIDMGSRYQSLHYNNFKFEIQLGILSGIADQYIKDVMEISLPSLNTIARNMFPHVESISYLFEPLPQKRWSYKAKVMMQSKEGPILLNHADVPEGLKRVMEILTVFINYYEERTVVMDDFDEMLHPNSLRYLLQVLLPHLKGQFIGVMNRVDMMNDIEPSSIYVSRYQDFDFEIVSINQDIQNQANHNVRSRYEQGIYGDFQEMRDTEMMKLIFEFNNQIRQYFDERR